MSSWEPHLDIFTQVLRITSELSLNELTLYRKLPSAANRCCRQRKGILRSEPRAEFSYVPLAL